MNRSIECCKDDFAFMASPTTVRTREVSHGWIRALTVGIIVLMVAGCDGDSPDADGGSDAQEEMVDSGVVSDAQQGSLDSGADATPETSDGGSESCSLPWGGTIAHGESVTAHSVSSVTCGQSCPMPETRECNDGNLSGSYQHLGCSPQDPICNPSVTRCSGNSIEECTSDGCAWSLLEECGSHRYCEDSGQEPICVQLCIPTTCGSEGKNCGTMPDGCGGTLFCGACPVSLRCGGGGTPNVCGGAGGGCESGIPRIVLWSSKSYVPQGDNFKFRVGLYLCTAGSYAIAPAASRNVTFQVKYIDGMSDGPGYRDWTESGIALYGSPGWKTWEETSTWSAMMDAQGEVEYNVNMNGRILLFRAIAVEGYTGPIASDWARVNYGTLFGLIDMADTSGNEPSFPISQDSFFSGVNFSTGNTGFLGRTIVQPTSGISSIYGRSPVTSANDRVFTWLKNLDVGYHNPRYGWFSSTATSLWHNGRSFINFWMQRHQLGAQEYFVSNNFEFGIWDGGTTPPMPDWSDPTYFDPLMTSYWKDSVWAATTAQAGICPVNACWLDVAHVNQTTNSDPAFRNYVFFPRYIADEWGIWVPHNRTHEYLWASHVKIWRRASIPGQTGADEDIVVQYQAYESQPACLQNVSGSCHGHREDMFFDQEGLLIVEGRRVESPACTTSPCGQCGNKTCQFWSAKDDEDVMHSRILIWPNYCMVRSGSGSCTLAGRESAP